MTTAGLIFGRPKIYSKSVLSNQFLPTGRRWLVAALLVLVSIGLFAPRSASAATSGGVTVSRKSAIAQLQNTRRSIDRTLSLLKSGRSTEAFAEARTGYLQHFEQVEVPLRVADAGLTQDAEAAFAEIRQAIRSNKPVGQIREKIVALRTVIDDAERSLTAAGAAAPAIVAGQSFLIIFREGFEIVLLMSVLLGYLEAAKSTRYMRPILAGVGLAVVATVFTLFALRELAAILPLNPEAIEAITAMLGVAVLFYVSFWLIARLEHKRWMEFLKARVWGAVSVGSVASLVLVGFTAVYREGFETALFYQSLLTFGKGLGAYVMAGLVAGLVALAFVAMLVFRLGRKLPVRTFMNVAVVMVMITSVAFLGNAIHSLQSADIVGYHALTGWPRAPIFLSPATGYRATVESIAAQAVLTVVYFIGGTYVFVIKPRLARRPSPSMARPAAA